MPVRELARLQEEPEAVALEHQRPVDDVALKLVGTLVNEFEPALADHLLDQLAGLR